MVPVVGLSGLEREFAADLPKARECLTRSDAKIPLRQISLYGLEIGMVEEVVELKPELKVESLGDVRVFVKVHIGLHVGGIPEFIWFLIAQGAWHRRGELRLREATGRESAMRSCLCVASDVRVVVVISIGVVISAV